MVTFEIRVCLRVLLQRERRETVPGRDAIWIEPAIPKPACAKLIKHRQKAIQRFFPVTAYTLGAWLGGWCKIAGSRG